MTPNSRGRVLLVEDDRDAALFFTHVLTRRGGFDVAHVGDPRAALDLAAGQRWDLVLADYDLPGMTGQELLGALRAQAPGLPGLLVSAQDPSLLPAGLPVLPKPVAPDHLVMSVAMLTA